LAPWGKTNVVRVFPAKHTGQVLIYREIGNLGTSHGKSELFERFDSWKIEWSLPVRYCINFKLRNLSFSSVKNDAYLDTFGSFPYKIGQNN
jgi:hypothetical protein